MSDRLTVILCVPLPEQKEHNKGACTHGLCWRWLLPVGNTCDLLFTYLLDLVYQKEEKVFGFVVFSLLVYCSGLDAYLSFCSWMLIRLNLAVIYVWPCVKTSVKKKEEKAAQFNCSFPAMEEKHQDGSSTVGLELWMSWCVVMWLVWVWIYCWLHPHCCKGSVPLFLPAPKTSGCETLVSAFHAGTAVFLWASLCTWLSASARIKEKPQIHGQEGIWGWEEK